MRIKGRRFSRFSRITLKNSDVGGKEHLNLRANGPICRFIDHELKKKSYPIMNPLGGRMMSKNNKFPTSKPQLPKLSALEMIFQPPKKETWRWSPRNLQNQRFQRFLSPQNLAASPDFLKISNTEFSAICLVGSVPDWCQGPEGWSTKGTPKIGWFHWLFHESEWKNNFNWMISWKWFIQFKSGCLTWMIYITNLY